MNKFETAEDVLTWAASAAEDYVGNDGWTTTDRANAQRVAKAMRLLRALDRAANFYPGSTEWRTVRAALENVI